MKKGILYLLLPLCITFLPACSQSHTLTLLNSDSECGTIITEGGEFKAGEKVQIEVEPAQGYKVEKWKDSVSGKVSTRSEFTFTMPNRDAELTVFYKYADFTLSFEEQITASEGYYDFSNYLNYPNNYISHFNVGDRWFSSDSTLEVTWKDSVELKNVQSYIGSKLLRFDGLYDENGTKLEDTNYVYEMPNHDTSLSFHYTSTCYVAIITSSFSAGGWAYDIGNNEYTTFHDSENTWCSEFYFTEENNKNITFEIKRSTGYVFDYWKDLDTGEIITTERSFVVEEFTGVHHYYAEVHKENE